MTKLNLTGHITFSVGWLGAVAVFLALAIVSLMSQSLIEMRAAYVAMEASAWYVIVPFCLASLLTGIMQAVGTKWGLFKYYWVTVKLFLTIFITVFLLLHLRPIAYLGGLPLESPLVDAHENKLRLQMVADAGAAILILLFITTISVFKPWGLIRLKATNLPEGSRNEVLRKPAGYYLLIGLGVLAVVIIVMHLFGGGLGSH